MPPPKKNPGYASSLSVEVGRPIDESTIMVLLSTAVFFHGTYRGTQSLVPPNTMLLPSEVTAQFFFLNFELCL